MARNPKRNRRPSEVYSFEEVDFLLKAISPRYPTGSRNRALIALGYDAGLRIHEALSLTPRDYNPDSREVYVRHGKGDKSRRLRLTEFAHGLLMDWLEKRKALGIGRAAPLFCAISKGNMGNPLTDAYIRAYLKRLERKAEFPKRLHFHGFRHSMAHDLMMRGTPVAIIQKALGHSSLATTETYLQGIAPADVMSAMGSREYGRE